jgi:hypothetical protein
LDITTNPLVVLASDVVTGAVTVWTGNIHVRNIEFVEYTSINDFALVNQTNGKIFAYLAAASDLETVKTNNIEWARGLVVPQGGITNGKLLIYIR